MTTAKKTHWLRTTILVLLACAVLGTALSAVMFFRDPPRTSASATVQFSFNGAADGVAPNGEEFDASGITSDKVISAGLDAAEMSGKYEAADIKENMLVRGVYPEDIVNQASSYDSLLDFSANRQLAVTDYHPTEFTVTLYGEFDSSISSADLRKLLGSILDEYRKSFVSEYSVSFEVNDIVSDPEKYDYVQQLELLSLSMSQTSEYAQVMYMKQPSFTANGMSFSDIAVRMDNLISTDVSRLNAIIIQNSITKDGDRLLTQYRYQIDSWNNQLEKKQEQLERLDALIEKYEKSEIIYVSTANSLTQIGGESQYDTLVLQRKALADEMTDISAKISAAQQRIVELGGTVETEETAAAGTADTKAGTEKTAENAEGAAETAATEETAAAAETEAEGSGGDSQASALTEELDQSVQDALDITVISEEGKAAAAAKQTAVLESGISTLTARKAAVEEDFKALLKAYNDQEMSEKSVSVSDIKYSAPSLLSGLFIKTVVKTAGPICALGFMACMVMIIVSRRKEQKRKKA